ncbi:MAG: YegP family protein [Bacilli bacterium]|jgi:uncharacterized protein YegP (UPF0339 family)|nr:YegP family protein [Bacilli bacterium]
MFNLFGLFKKKAKKNETVVPEGEIKKTEPAPEEVKEEKKEEQKPVEEKKETPEPEEKKEEKKEEKPEVKKEVKEKAPKAAKKTTGEDNRYTGKYEIYPEAEMFKFRLKASNGEILLVSIGYKTKDGALSGIETVKKNIPLGNSTIVTDKNGYSQFRFNSANNSRLVIAGEYYNSLASCKKALSSTEKFYATKKIVYLDSIPASEVREEIVQANNLDNLPNGKLELFIDKDGKWRGRLIASNGEILFVTNDYASKQGVLIGLRAIKEKTALGVFRLCKDKQGRFNYKLTTENGQIILVGETYTSRAAALSAIDSTRRFLPEASIVNTEEKETEEEKE